MTTTAREIERTYESRLQEQLQAMRAEFDARLNKNRRDIDETYKVCCRGFALLAEIVAHPEGYLRGHHK